MTDGHGGNPVFVMDIPHNTQKETEMTQKELYERIHIAELKFSEIEETIADLVRDIEQYSVENPEFCELFWDKKLKEQGKICQNQLKDAHQIMRASYATMAERTELEKDYKQLISDRKFLEGAGASLMTLLGMLSPEKKAPLHKAYFTEIDGKKRDLDKVSLQYNILKEKLKKEAVDADSFERATTFRKKMTENCEPLIKGETKVGNIITYGRYPQTEEGNDQTPIEWQVLEVKDGKALVISKYGIDCKQYHEEWKNIAWEHCSLREWLNSEFLDTAFSKEEQSLIEDTYCPANKNLEPDIPPRNVKTDKVFLLSNLENEKYFKSKEDRKAAPTTYARTQAGYTDVYYETANGKAACKWWLRWPDKRSFFTLYVSHDGSYSSITVNGVGVCVRPALWINLES